jgi:FixJ family two-component response regulator
MSEPTAYVIDDDESIRELLGWLMKRHSIRAQTFSNAHAFLKAYTPGSPGCVILDLYMPGMSGLDLQQYLIAQGIEVKNGAIDFIEKPFDYKRIVSLVQECLGRDAQARATRGKAREVAGRIATLTTREREVMDCVVAGKMNRVIAEELAISIKTVEAHRARLMEKLGVHSVAELVQAAMAARAPSGGVEPGG